MSTINPDAAHARAEEGFREELSPGLQSAEHLTLGDLHHVKLELSADLGRCTMLVREVLELKRGSVLALDKLAGEMADVHVNGVPFAKGEIVVLADTLHVRISEVINPKGNYES